MGPGRNRDRSVLTLHTRPVLRASRRDRRTALPEWQALESAIRALPWVQKAVDAQPYLRAGCRPRRTATRRRAGTPVREALQQERDGFPRRRTRGRGRNSHTEDLRIEGRG